MFVCLPFQSHFPFVLFGSKLDFKDTEFVTEYVFVTVSENLKNIKFDTFYISDTMQPINDKLFQRAIEIILLPTDLKHLRLEWMRRINQLTYESPVDPLIGIFNNTAY